MGAREAVDLVVIGGGPSGQKAATQATKAGLRVVMVERDSAVGGECVHRGTIPSKTMRESALYLHGLRSRTGSFLGVEVPERLKVAALMGRLRSVLANHERYMARQLDRNGIDVRHGVARFLSDRVIELTDPRGERSEIRADLFVIASGSRPRKPDNVLVDHEHVLDSDSILSLIYLPRSLTVLGGGVIASEFASVFAALGTHVTMLDSHERPLGFLDPEIVDLFVAGFERHGGEFRPGARIERCGWDGVSQAVTRLEDGTEVQSDKALCALGRVAQVSSMDVEAAGVTLTPRGHVAVDEHLRTSTPHIYAVGDVIGPPALAATAMEQGRRAVLHALGLDAGSSQDTVPTGIYTIPEIASVGMSAVAAEARYGGAVVGRARFDELARGHINGNTDGLLKLVCDPAGRRILGAEVIGEGATEIVHVAQVALLGGLEVDAFVDNVFNFPTLGEGFRVAALDVCNQRVALRATA